MQSLNIEAARRDPLRRALVSCKNGLYGVFLFSMVMNLLLLTGPFFMLQIYDRVLTSRSVETLIALASIAGGLYLCYGLFDWTRSRLLSSLSHAFDRPLAETSFQRSLDGDSNTQLATEDLKQVQIFMGGPAIATLFDVPWFPVYLGVVFLLHPFLGWIALSGAVLLVIIAILNQVASARASLMNSTTSAQEDALVLAGRRQVDALTAMGAVDHIGRLWRTKHDERLDYQSRVIERQAIFSAASRTVRLVLQSAMLGFGAYLVLGDTLSPGALIAASIIFARALAPLDQSIAHWRAISGARLAYKRLQKVLGQRDLPAVPTKIALPKQRLLISELFVAAPDKSCVLLEGVSLALKAGDAMGIIGASGGGKSTLLKGLLGLWPTTRGEVRLDGATLDQWSMDRRGDIIGYLPQETELFPGTIAQNISRFQPNATSDRITEAAAVAGVHDLIVSLPEGYDTVVGPGGQQLSGGERQRIALARAVYGTPFLVVLDEPNSNMDGEGERALASTISTLRQRGSIVLIVTHRRAVLAEVNKLLQVEKRRPIMFGETATVLNKIQEQAQALNKRNLQVVK